MCYKTACILRLWYYHGLMHLDIWPPTVMTIWLQVWLVACCILKVIIVVKWHLNRLLNVGHSHLRIYWDGHNHHRDSTFCQRSILEVLSLYLGNLVGTNWHVITNRLPVKALSTRVSFLKVKIWLRLHQRNILEAAKSLWALRRILISWKMLSLAFQRLLMQYTV